jgi:hypothetical protein
MNARWAGVVVLLVAVGCWAPRVEPPGDDGPPVEKKDEEKRDEKPLAEDPAAAAAMLRLQESGKVLLQRDLRAAGKPIIRVQVQPGPGDNPLKHLVGLAHLRELIIQNESVPLKLIADLERLPELKALDLVNSRVNDEALAAISRLKHLEVLRIRISAVTAKGLAHLEKMTGLRELDLGVCPGLTDESARHLAALTKLRVLSLPNNAGISDAALATVGKLTALERLDLESCGKVGDEGVKALAGLKSLKVLKLSYTRVGDEGLAALAGLPLEELSLNLTKATGANLGKFPKLKQLWMREAETPDKALKALAQKATYLRFLDLSGSKLDDAAAEQIQELKYLHDLDVSNTKLTAKGLMGLARAPRLIHVTVSVVSDGDKDTEITQEAVAEFRKANPKIKVSQ